MTSSPCFVLHPDWAIDSLDTYMGPMPSLVSSYRLLVWRFFLSFPFFLFLSFLCSFIFSKENSFVFISCLSFSFYFLNNYFILFFSLFFPFDLSLTCVCVGIGTTCNIYVVCSFLGGKRCSRFFQASSETYVQVWTRNTVG